MVGRNRSQRGEILTAGHTNPPVAGVHPVGMKRKFIIGAVVAGVLGLAAYVVISGGKSKHRYRSGGEAMTVEVELPKTNNTSPASSDVRYRRDGAR